MIRNFDLLSQTKRQLKIQYLMWKLIILGILRKNNKIENSFKWMNKSNNLHYHYQRTKESFK